MQGFKQLIRRLFGRFMAQDPITDILRQDKVKNKTNGWSKINNMLTKSTSMQAVGTYIIKIILKVKS